MVEVKSISTKGTWASDSWNVNAFLCSPSTPPPATPKGSVTGSLLFLCFPIFEKWVLGEGWTGSHPQIWVSRSSIWTQNPLTGPSGDMSLSPEWQYLRKEKKDFRFTGYIRIILVNRKFYPNFKQLKSFLVRKSTNRGFDGVKKLRAENLQVVTLEFCP